MALDRAGTAGILVAQRHPSYRDIPGQLYHFPKPRYLERMQALQGSLVLLYEPQRGGGGVGTRGGGRSAFVGTATVGEIRTDPEDENSAYADLLGYLDLPRVVPLGETGIVGASLQSVVKVVDRNLVDTILTLAFAPLAKQTAGRVREGMVELDLPSEDFARPVRESLTRRPVRDAAFRLRVVEQVYGGRCALSGLRLLNGNGRAEADAAHIRPVERGGPDAIRNGIALSKTLHWAFDRGLVSLTDEGRILLVERGIENSVRRLVVDTGLAILPGHPEDRPHPAYLRWHRENVFKGAA